MTIGAYYFDGWWTRTQRLQQEFADREPRWGWADGTQELMEAQIDDAVRGGLSFFAFDWYYPEGDAAARHSDPHQLHAPASATADRLGLEAYQRCRLNDALRLYLAAANRGPLRFCLLVANHAPFRILRRDWDAVRGLWMEFFADPGYLRLEGRPLLIIYHPHQLVEAFGGPEALRVGLASLRQACVARGLTLPLVAACSAGPARARGRDDVDQLLAAGYDLFTGYNYRGAVRLPRGAHAPYALLRQTHEDIWHDFGKNTRSRYIPLATAGWDNRPRNPEQNLSKPFFWFDPPTPEALADHIQRAIEWADVYPDHSLDEQPVLIYSWNEVAEGASLVPTKAEGDTVLQCVQRAKRRAMGDDRSEAQE